MSETELSGDALAAEVANRARWQADWCARLGSPLYGDIIERAASDVEAGGPFNELMTDPAIDPLGPLPMLRLMGAANRLALTGRAPPVSWDSLLDLVRDRPDDLREHMNRPVQTNEVARCGPLAAGFLFVARERGLPLRLLEVGASAGLNLRFDRYRYETEFATWGPEESPVRLTGFWGGGEPPYDAELSVMERRGCDLEPVDPTTEEGRLTLLSYVWPDQHERVAHLRGALEVAPEIQAPVEQADARTWVERVLTELPDGTATVLFHSIVMQYLSDEERKEFEAAVAAAGERAGERSRLEWLRMEFGGEQCELRLRSWPGGEERLLASCGFHGGDVVWQA